MPATTSPSSVYGPVQSWRYGRSLGIDPIGAVSTCPLNCVYCQLGEIEQKTGDRQLFISTEQILRDLQPYAPWDVDVITLSGSGEPTLALNLGEILSRIHHLTHRPLVVLTNGCLLSDPQVRQDLAIASQVAVKIDAVTPDQFRRINRPVSQLSLEQNWEGLHQFRHQYRGHLAIQTMLLSDWSAEEKAAYAELVRAIAPDEIQLNTPTRPKPLHHQLDTRGNHTQEQPYPVRQLKPLTRDALQAFSTEISHTTRIPVNLAPVR